VRDGGLAVPGEDFLAIEFDPEVHVTPFGRRFLLRNGLAQGHAPPIAGGASFSDAYEAKVLEHVAGKATLTLVTPVFLALTTVVPTDSSTGTTITEASYTGYARKKVEAADWAAASGTSPTAIKNSKELVFAACTGSTSTVIGFALCDALTVGNVIMWGTCSSTVISTTQTPATVAVEALSMTLD
jgi:hypothetical protein